MGSKKPTPAPPARYIDCDNHSYRGPFPCPECVKSDRPAVSEDDSTTIHYKIVDKPNRSVEILIRHKDKRTALTSLLQLATAGRERIFSYYRRPSVGSNQTTDWVETTLQMLKVDYKAMRQSDQQPTSPLPPRPETQEKAAEDIFPDLSIPPLGTPLPIETYRTSCETPNVSNTCKESQESISKWAEDTFGPASSNTRVAARVNEEMAELLKKLSSDDDHPDAPEEIADVVIVLSRLAQRLGCDIQEEIDKKMAKNRSREWKLDGSGHGYHVKEEIKHCRPPERTPEPIPKDVYYNIERDNFYSSSTLHGMGDYFYQQWKTRRFDFPQGWSETKESNQQ